MAVPAPAQELDPAELARRLETIPGGNIVNPPQPSRKIEEPPAWNEIKESDEYKALNFPDQVKLARQWGEETKTYAATLPDFTEDQAAQIDNFVANEAVEVPANIKRAASAAGLFKGAAAGLGAMAGGLGGAAIGGPVGAIGGGVGGMILAGEAAEAGLEKVFPAVAESRKYAPGYATAGEYAPSVAMGAIGVRGLATAGKALARELGTKKAVEEIAKTAAVSGVVGGGVGTATRAVLGAEVTPRTVAEDVLFGALFAGLGSGARVQGYTKEQALNLNERVKAGRASETEFRDWQGILAEAERTQARGVESAKRTEVELGGRPVFQKTELTQGPQPETRPVPTAELPSPRPAGLQEIGVVESPKTVIDSTRPSINDFYNKLEKHDWSYRFSESSYDYKIGSAQEEEIQQIIKQGGSKYKKLYEDYYKYAFGKSDIKPEIPKELLPTSAELVREGEIITPRRVLPTTQRAALPERAEMEVPAPTTEPAAPVGQPIPRPMGGAGEAGFVSSDITKLIKNYMTSAGALTDDMAETLLAQKYNKAQLEYEAKFRLRDFNKAVLEETGSSKMSPELMRSVSDYINGKSTDTSAIPQKVVEAANRFRSFLDQGARKIISEPGLLTEAQKQTVEANIGSYLSRSYEKFDNPNFTMDMLEQRDKPRFAKSVDFVKRQFLDRAKEEVETAAEDGRPPIEWLRQINETQSVPRERLMGEIQRIVESGGAMEARRRGETMRFTPESYGISKDLQGLKKRKEIPEEIRYLMGEYEDPRVNFLRSALKQINLYVDQRTLTNLRDQGFEAGLFFDYPAPGTVEIAPKGSEVMSPLNGVYAAPDVAEALNNFDVSYNSGVPGLRTFAKINAAIKWSKTVGSLRSQARNFIFNIPIQIQNGNFDFLTGKDFGRTTQMIMSDYGIGSDTQAIRSELRRAIGLGVVNNAKFNEMEAMMKDAAMDRGDIQNFVERHFYKYVAKPVSAGLDSAFAIKDFMDFMYRAGDNFHKIALWKYRTRALMDGKKMSKEDAEVEAADYVNNSFSTYEKLGRLMKSLRANPFSKNFISWNAERVRNSYHILKQASRDLKDPGMRKYGIRTIIGNIISAGIFATTRLMAAYAFGWTLEKIKELNKLAPNYQKSGTLLPVGYDPKKKEVTYIDLSYSDPFDIFRQPINAFMSEESLDKALIGAIATFFGDFLGLSIATETAAGIIKNERADGTQIVNPKASPTVKLMKYSEYAGRVIEPGTISDIRQMYYAIKGEPDPFFGPRAPVPSIAGMASSAAGFRVQKLNVADEVFKKARSFNSNMGLSTRLFTSELVARGTPEERRLAEGKQEMDRARIETFKDMRKVYNAALSWGLTSSEAAAEMKRGGMSSSNIGAVITGRIPRYEPSRKMMRELYRQSPEDFERRQAITRELLQESE
jgi:hypothetical protein